MNRTFRSINRLTVLALALAGGCGCLLAQTNTPPRPGDSPNPNRRAPATTRAVPGSLGTAVDIRVASVLTPEQRESLQSLLQSRRDKLRQLETQLRLARKDLLDLGATGKFDEAEIRQKAKALGEAEAEFAIFRARLLSEMKPPLSSDQITKMREPRADRTNAAASAGADPTGRLRLLSPAAIRTNEPAKTP